MGKSWSSCVRVNRSTQPLKMAQHLMLENVWLQQQKFEDANSLYRRLQAGTAGPANTTQTASSTLAGEIAQVRQGIQNALNKPAPKTGAGGGGGDASVLHRLDALEKENKELRKITDDLRALILTIQASVGSGQAAPTTAVPAPKATPAPTTNGTADDDDDDSDDDLFGSDSEEETEEAKAERQKRLAQYAEKKSKKPALIAKSSLLLACKPWDDETDMAEMEKCIRSIEQDGLLWGASKLVPLAYGIKKLQINCVVEDDKVGVDDLTERITEEFEDYVQSVDVDAFNKI